MDPKVREFLKIARIEIEELLENVEARIEATEKRRGVDEIMERVCRENLTVYRNETSCIRRFLQYLQSLCPAPEAGLDEVMASILAECRKDVHECGYAPCAYIFAERRLRKARRYVTEDDDR